VKARTNTLELEYESFGDEKGQAIVLIMGFAQQLLSWDLRFCQHLAARGFRVVRFDNRDVGLSTKLDTAPIPDIAAILRGDTSSIALDRRHGR